MSHGTVIYITFNGGDNYVEVAMLAKEHLPRIQAMIDERVAQGITALDHTLEVTKQYLVALAEQKIWVPSAHYPGAPITFSTVDHRMEVDDVIKLLIPFFTELYCITDRADDYILDLTESVVITHQYENGPAKVVQFTPLEETNRSFSRNPEVLKLDKAEFNLPAALNWIS